MRFAKVSSRECVPGQLFIFVKFVLFEEITDIDSVVLNVDFVQHIMVIKITSFFFKLF